MSDHPNRKLAAIVFTDIVGYSAMMNTDEKKGLQKLTHYQGLLDQFLSQYQGDRVKDMGDGDLCVFDSAVSAVRFSKDLQEALRVNPYVPLRIGIHLGDIVIEDRNVYGDGVNIAARIESIGIPGGIFFSESIYKTIKSQADLSTKSLGQFSFKHIEEPIEIFALANDGFPIPKRSDLRGKLKESKMPSPIQFAKIFGMLLIIGLLGTLLYNQLNPAPKEIVTKPATPPAPPAIAKNSIAVLPFDDLSPKQDQAYFGDGIAEEILDAISQVKDVKVAGRASSFYYRDKDLQPQEIGRQLGVANILYGSVRVIKDKVKVSAELINALDGFQIWKHSIDGKLDDIFKIQEQIAIRVTKQFNATHQLGSQKTNNQTAYQQYLKGQHLAKQDLSTFPTAISYFEEAIALDSNYVAAYCGLGFLYTRMGMWELIPSKIAYDQVKLAGQKAIAINPNQVAANTLLGAGALYRDFDWQEGKKHLEKAYQLDPKNIDAGMEMANYYVYTGDFKKGLKIAQEAIATDPLNFFRKLDLSYLQKMARQHDAAFQTAKSVLDFDPNRSDAYFEMADNMAHQGKYKLAISYYQKVIELVGKDPDAVLALATALAQDGQIDAAKQELSTLTDFPANPNHIVARFLIGEEDKAIQLLEQAYTDHTWWMMELKVNPRFDPLRKHPSFKSLLERMNIPG